VAVRTLLRAEAKPQNKPCTERGQQKREVEGAKAKEEEVGGKGSSTPKADEKGENQELERDGLARDLCLCPKPVFLLTF
jgi:hypothetical protein